MLESTQGVCPRGPVAHPGMFSTPKAFRTLSHPCHLRSNPALGAEELWHSLEALSVGTEWSMHPEPLKLGFSLPLLNALTASCSG